MALLCTATRRNFRRTFVRLIIDSHLDLSWNALSWNRDLTQSIASVREAEADMTDDDARGHGTVTLPEMRRGGVAVCCGTFLTAQRDTSNDT